MESRTVRIYAEVMVINKFVFLHLYLGYSHHLSIHPGSLPNWICLEKPHQKGDQKASLPNA